MNRIEKGDIVTRKSYNNDILFIIEKKYTNSFGINEVVLKGLNIRIIADSPLSDLNKISKKEILNSINKYKIDEESKIKKICVNTRQKIYTGKILHLDGDRKYSEKSARYYNKIGLNAVVKNIIENKQAKVIIPLLNKYNPDILIITGHDAMFKKGSNYNNLYNYRNSRYFMDTVKEARTWRNGLNKLVIFAGACQSYYEGIISARRRLCFITRKNFN